MKLTEPTEWRDLESHFQQIQHVHLKELFRGDPLRANKFTLNGLGLYVDFSKNRITEKTVQLLVKLAKAAGLKDAIKEMFEGKRINKTENRPVLHIALRNRSNRPIYVNDRDVMPDVNAVLEKMADFSHRVRTGKWKGFTGKRIKNIVNIGIGGSDLGPAFACEALRYYSDRNLNVSFVSNVE